MIRFKRLASVLIATAMTASMSGCGSKKAEIIEDYGNGATIAATESLEEASEEAFEEGSSLTIQNEEYQFQDEFNVGSVKVSIDITSEPLTEYAFPSFSAEKVSEANLNAEQYAKKLFGDTAVQLDETPKSNENVVVWDEDFEAANSEGYDYMEAFKEYAFSEDKSDKATYSYQGKYDGVDYYLVVSFNRETGMSEMKMFPVNPGDLCEDTTLGYVTPYDPAYFNIPEGTYDIGSMYMFPRHVGYILENGELLAMDAANGAALDIRKNMKENPNKCSLTNEQLKNHALEFLENDLGMGVEGTYIYPNSSDLFYYFPDLEDDKSDEELSEENESEKDDKANNIELVFSTHNNFPEIDYNTSVRDGYRVKVQGIFFKDEDTNGFGASLCEGYVDISSKGIVGFDYIWKYGNTEVISDDTSLLDFENLMQGFEKAISDSTEIANTRTSNLKFSDFRMEYVAVQSSDNSDEYGFIPSWVFDGYNNDGSYAYTAYINAIDGSLVMEETK